MIHLPALVLPGEFISLLKNPSAAASSGSPVVPMLRQSPGLTMVMEKAFAEFNEHKIGLEKIFTTLGWAHFRERMASVYVFKAMYGTFPDKTDMELVSDVHEFEDRFREKALSGSSRLYLLGLYLKFINIYLSMREDTVDDVDIPDSVNQILALSPLRSDRPDWLVLLVWHLDAFLGTARVMAEIQSGSSWEQMFSRLSEQQQFQLISNLLSYGATIQEEDPFLYERI